MDYRPTEDYTFGEERDRHLERWNEPHRQGSRYVTACLRVGKQVPDWSKEPDWVKQKKAWWTLEQAVKHGAFPMPLEDPERKPPEFVQDDTDSPNPDIDFSLWKVDETGQRVDIPKKEAVLDPNTGRLVCGGCQAHKRDLTCKNCLELNMVAGLELVKLQDRPLSIDGHLLMTDLRDRRRVNDRGQVEYNFKDQPLYKNRWNKSACSTCKQSFLTDTHFKSCLSKNLQGGKITAVEMRDVIDERIQAGFVCSAHQRLGCFDCVHQSNTGKDRALYKRRQEVSSLYFVPGCTPRWTRLCFAPVGPSRCPVFVFVNLYVFFFVH